MGYDYGWDWDWLFVQHFARKLRDLGYSPWYIGSRLAEVYEFLHKYKEDETTAEVQCLSETANEVEA